MKKKNFTSKKKTLQIDDFFPKQFRDYIIDGPTYEHRRDIVSWGGEWDHKELRWLVKNTSPDCPDYQALTDLGLNLLPIQESHDEKVVLNQLKRG